MSANNNNLSSNISIFLDSSILGFLQDWGRGDNFSLICGTQIKYHENIYVHTTALYPHYFPGSFGTITFNLDKTHFIVPAEHYVPAG